MDLECDAPFIIAEAAQGLDHFDGSLDGLIVDFGAHVGAFSCAAAERGRNTVIALEPDPDNFALLIKNIRSNNLWGKVVPVGCGVYWDAGPIGLGVSGNNSGSKSIYGERRTMVWMDLPSRFLSEPVAYCKMDIEGAEWPIFENYGFSWLSNVQAFEIETHAVAGRDFDADCAELNQQLIGAGFKRHWGGSEIHARLYQR